MSDLVPVQEKLIPVTVNITESGRDFMRASAEATGRSMSGWLRRVLDGMVSGRIGPKGAPPVAAAAATPVTPAAAPGVYSTEPPEGAEWVLCEITAGDVGREGWLRL